MSTNSIKLALDIYEYRDEPNHIYSVKIKMSENNYNFIPILVAIEDVFNSTEKKLKFHTYSKEFEGKFDVSKVLTEYDIPLIEKMFNDLCKNNNQ